MLVTSETAQLANVKNYFGSYYNTYWRPTQSELQTWLRDKYKILVCPIYSYNDSKWCVHIEDINKMTQDEESVLISGIDFFPALYDSFEGALEQGLLESLKLIKV